MCDVTDHMAAAVAMIQQLALAKREGDADALNEAAALFDSVPGLRETVHEVANGKTYAEIQGGRWKSRQREKRKMYEEMAREFERRQLEYANRGESIGATDLKAEVGRLPRFKLKRSAASTAVNRGLAIINVRRSPSVVPGIPDG